MRRDLLKRDCDVKAVGSVKTRYQTLYCESCIGSSRMICFLVVVFELFCGGGGCEGKSKYIRNFKTD